MSPSIPRFIVHAAWLCAAVAGATALCANAAYAAATQEFTRSSTVVTGLPLRLGFFTNVDPDCVPTGTTTVRPIKQPKHGTFDIDNIIGFVSYSKDNVRSACNTKKVDGVAATYTSTENYTGKDTLTFDVIFPSGGSRRYIYTIDVK